MARGGGHLSGLYVTQEFGTMPETQKVRSFGIQTFLGFLRPDQGRGSGMSGLGQGAQ
jgi:hypothetical protein